MDSRSIEIFATFRFQKTRLSCGCGKPCFWLPQPCADDGPDAIVNAEFGKSCSEMDRSLGRMPNCRSALALLARQNAHISARIALIALARLNDAEDPPPPPLPAGR